MTADSDLDRILRAADPAAGRQAPAADAGPLGLTAGAPRPVGRRWLPVAASVAAVVAVVGVAATVAGLAPDSADRQPGASPRPVPTTAPPPGAQTEPPQREHTTASGAEYERAKRLLATLQGAVPAGYTVPEGGTGHPGVPGPTSGPGATMPTIGPGGTGMFAAYFQAVRDEGPYDGYRGYLYMANTIVSRGSHIGSLAARVWVGIPDWSPDPCVVLARIYGKDGSCRVLTTADGERVGVVDSATGAPTPGSDRRERQWAGYRRTDGTVVLVSQGPGVLNQRIPALERPVFTPLELATLATDDRLAA